MLRPRHHARRRAPCCNVLVGDHRQAGQQDRGKGQKRASDRGVRQDADHADECRGRCAEAGPDRQLPGGRLTELSPANTPANRLGDKVRASSANMTTRQPPSTAFAATTAASDPGVIDPLVPCPPARRRSPCGSNYPASRRASPTTSRRTLSQASEPASAPDQRAASGCSVRDSGGRCDVTPHRRQPLNRERKRPV